MDMATALAAEGDQAGIEVHQEAGTDRLADLINKGVMFDPCFTDPRMLACLVHVLGDFKLSSLNFRAALPGHGTQMLHSYFGRRSRGQQLDQKKYARPETLARLSPAARFILDV